MGANMESNGDKERNFLQDDMNSSPDFKENLKHAKSQLSLRIEYNELEG